MYVIGNMDTQGGGARVGARKHHLHPLENLKKISLYDRHFAIFPPFYGPFSMWGPFILFYIISYVYFLGLAPPPSSRIILQAPMQKSRYFGGLVM